jgi:alkanesulfonate monooxygenase SsuD/methylene tetrahydromethanopterin reductase-like flavin-dependent oxidoreductase (luciferase family)
MRRRVRKEIGLEYGTFMMPLHNMERDYTQVLKEDREAIILADKLGFKEAYVGEHVTDRTEPITSCTMFLATLLDATENIKLGSGTVNLPNNHPAIVAAQVAMLDHLLEGRFMFGIGPGGLRSDMEVFENLDRDRGAMFVEAIDQILAIWSGEPPYNLTGEYWNITTEQTLVPEVGQGIFVKPYQQPHPPIVVTTIAPHSKGLVKTAERGWLPLSSSFVQAEIVATHWPMHAQGRKNVGAVPDVSDWRIGKSIFVADDEATAQRYGKAMGGPYAHYFETIMGKLVSAGRIGTFKADQSMPDEDVTLEWVVDSLVIAGTVNSVVAQILKFRETTGDFGMLVYCGHDWLDADLSKRSMQLFAEEVMPRVNAAIGESAAAE